MADILERIIQTKRAELAQISVQVTLDHLQQSITQLPPCRDFFRAVAQPNPRGINVIAEIKKASPSAGLIRPDFDPAQLARIYQSAGADAISVLTDQQFFQGRLEYVNQAKQAVSLPILRKDFIIDPYQVFEARAAGADAILLIAEALPPAQLVELLELAHSLTLTVLVEIHHPDSLQHLQDLIQLPRPNVALLGINNRNLKQMTVDLNTSLRLAQSLGAVPGLVSESGIKQRPDVQRLIQAGFSGVLIGETLMRAQDITAKFKELFG